MRLYEYSEVSLMHGAWGRFVVLADPDGRSVVLARMNTAAAAGETS